jgi:hypothetical protein
MQRRGYNVKREIETGMETRTRIRRRIGIGREEEEEK